MHAFVLWDEAGVPHKENPRADLNPGSSWCDVTVLTTALCCPTQKKPPGKMEFALSAAFRTDEKINIKLSGTSSEFKQEGKRSLIKKGGHCLQLN